MSIEQPLVSVIIPTYNSSRFVVEAVESVLAQTYRALEIIVVDDGSTDDTRQKLAPFESRIRYFWQPNNGVGKARNRGMTEAQGDLLGFLDADDQWMPQKLELQVARLAGAPNAALVHTDVKYLDDASGKHLYHDRGRQHFQGECYDRLFFRNHVVPSAVLARRECIEAVGRFTEAPQFEGCEDYDLWIRLARRFHFAYEPSQQALYRLHANNMSANRAKMAGSELNVIHKALLDDPDLRRRIGPSRVRKRIFDLNIDVGYTHFDRSELTLARPYLASAVRQRLQSGHTWALWLATFLPAGVVRKARSFKQQLR